MLEFFLENFVMDQDGWSLIFYTGRSPLNPALNTEELNMNVRIIRGRPDLHVVIPNIIYGIESRKGLPESTLPDAREEVKRKLHEKMLELDGTDLSTNDKLLQLTALAQSSGFVFGELAVSMKAESQRFSSSPVTQEPSEERVLMLKLRLRTWLVSQAYLMERGC